MEQHQLEELVKTFLSQYSLTLSELKWHQEGKSRILQCAIMREDGSMDLDTCSEISEAIGPHLDEWLKNIDHYTLEVCSPGAERMIHSAQELQRVVGQHVYVLFEHPLEKSLEHTGKLKSFDGQKGQLEIRVKTRTKTIEFDYQNIVKIRLAVVL